MNLESVSYCDFNVLFFQLFDVRHLLLESLSLLVFDGFGNQDVVVRQRRVLCGKNVTSSRTARDNREG